MLGPVIGSGLYLAGGFQMPFFVIGSLFAVTGLTYFVLIPNQKQQQKEKEQPTTGTKSLTLSEAAKVRTLNPLFVCYLFYLSRSLEGLLELTWRPSEALNRRDATSGPGAKDNTRAPSVGRVEK